MIARARAVRKGGAKYACKGDCLCLKKQRKTSGFGPKNQRISKLTAKNKPKVLRKVFNIALKTLLTFRFQQAENRPNKPFVHSFHRVFNNPQAKNGFYKVYNCLYAGAASRRFLGADFCLQNLFKLPKGVQTLGDGPGRALLKARRGTAKMGRNGT